MFEFPEVSFAVEFCLEELDRYVPCSPRWTRAVKTLRRVEQTHLRSQGRRRCTRCWDVHPEDFYYKTGEGHLFGACKACHKVHVARTRAERRGGKAYKPRKRAGAVMIEKTVERARIAGEKARRKKEKVLLDRGVPTVTAAMKRCSRCKGMYSLHGENFHKNGKSKDGFSRQCKACVAKLAEIRRDARGKE